MFDKDKNSNFGQDHEKMLNELIYDINGEESENEKENFNKNNNKPSSGYVPRR